MEHTRSSFPLLELPCAALLGVLRSLDARSLVNLELSGAAFFSRRERGCRLNICEEVSRERVLARLGGSMEAAERFRHRSWRERLYLEECTGVGFDRTFSETGGFQFLFAPDGAALQSVRLLGMGPKLLVSDASTADQPVLHWQLRVQGNTAVEFGVIPADLPPTHTALHKCLASPSCPHHRAQGFSSQITAGSLLPLKAPVMRGTLVDVVARRGHLEVLLRYPADAKEVSWQNGQPVQRPYRGPAQLRLEQDFPADYDVRLAVTSWARAHFEVLHSGFEIDPEWAAAAATEQAAAATQQQMQMQDTAAAELAAAAGLHAQPAMQAADLLMLPQEQQHQLLQPAAQAAGQGPLLAGAAYHAAALAVGGADAALPEPHADLMALPYQAAVPAGMADPAHLAALQYWGAQHPAEQHAELAAAGVAAAPGVHAAMAAAAAAGAELPTLADLLVGHEAAPPAPHGPLAPLCPSPSARLSMDGQVPSSD